MKKLVGFLILSGFLLEGKNLGYSSSCITTPSALQSALTTAAGNGQDDTICVEGNLVLSNPLTYTPSGADCGKKLVLVSSGPGAILDGDNNVRILKIDASGCASDTSEIIVEGFIFKNGKGGGGTGGGLEIRKGGGITKVLRNTFVGSSASAGGGAYVYSYGGSVEVVNNVFVGNVATSGGGGIELFIHSGSIKFLNNTLSSNTAFMGGGVYIGLGSGTATADVYNNIIWDNSASAGSNDGDELYINNSSGGVVNLAHNLFGGSGTNFASVPQGDKVYVANGGGYNSGVIASCASSGAGYGNKQQNPLFVGSGNFRLSANSPAVDAGCNVPGLPTVDRLGTVRVVDTVDMGAYEIKKLTITKSGNGSVNTGDCSLSEANNSYTCRVNSGTTVNLSAQPASGYTLSGWGGSCASCGTNSSCSVSIVGITSCSISFSSSGSGGNGGNGSGGRNEGGNEGGGGSSGTLVSDRTDLPTEKGPVNLYVRNGTFTHPPAFTKDIPPLPISGIAPYGALSFSVQVSAGYDRVLVRISFPDIPSNVVFYKLVNGRYLPLEVQVDNKTISFSVVDNSSYDANSQLGIIGDPVVMVVKKDTQDEKPKEKSGNGGGCSTGSAHWHNILWWFLPFVVLLRKRLPLAR